MSCRTPPQRSIRSSIFSPRRGKIMLGMPPYFVGKRKVERRWLHIAYLGFLTILARISA